MQLCVCLSVCLYAQGPRCIKMSEDNLERVGSGISPCGSQGSYSDHQARQQVPLPTKTTHWYKSAFLNNEATQIEDPDINSHSC